jgi:hypothetical protein
MTSQLTLERDGRRYIKSMGATVVAVLLAAGLIGVVSFIGFEAPDLTNQAIADAVPLEDFSGVDEFVATRAESRVGIPVLQEDFSGVDEFVATRAESRVGIPVLQEDFTGLD